MSASTAAWQILTAALANASGKASETIEMTVTSTETRRRVMMRAHHLLAPRRLGPPNGDPAHAGSITTTKSGGWLIRHARYFTLQLAESYLTGNLFRQILQRIERLAWHPR